MVQCNSLKANLINFLLSLRRLIKISQIRIAPQKPICILLSTTAAIIAGMQFNTPAIAAGVSMILWLSLLFLLGILSKADIVWVYQLVKKGRS